MRIKFKIDLIVWKLKTKQLVQSINKEFKIDLIVWKYIHIVAKQQYKNSLK